MAETIIDVGRQVPALAALIFLVLTGLREMRIVTTSFLKQLSESEKVREDSLKRLASECHSVQRDSVKAMNDVSKYLAQNTEASHSLHILLQRIANKE